LPPIPTPSVTPLKEGEYAHCPTVKLALYEGRGTIVDIVYNNYHFNTDTIRKKSFIANQ